MMNRPKTLIAIGILMCLTSDAGTKTAMSDRTEITPIRSQLAGDWQSTQFGTQTLCLRPDGSADLKMRLSTMAAVLYGRNVTLRLKWKLEGEILTQQIVGGSPERSVLKLTEKYGSSYVYRVLALTPGNLTVEDVATGKTCSWNSMSSASNVGIAE